MKISIDSIKQKSDFTIVGCIFGLLVILFGDFDHHLARLELREREREQELKFTLRFTGQKHSLDSGLVVFG